MVAKAGEIKVRHGLDPSVQLGPLVPKERHEKVTGYIESGRKEGAKVETGGGVIGNQGYFVEPTVLTKTNRDMRVVKEEIFGPVVCVQSFEDDHLDQVAKFANDTEYGLQASIWTRNLKVAHTLARRSAKRSAARMTSRGPMNLPPPVVQIASFAGSEASEALVL